MSEIRRQYFARLIGRIVIFIACIIIYFTSPQIFEILEGQTFFREISWFHILWCVWMVDMILQVLPVKSKIALGSQKLFANRFRPIREKINYNALRSYIITTTKSAYRVMLIWLILIGIIGVLHYFDVLHKRELFIISVFFYVCDLICVLIWCPFRLIMKNKCCTTCRIFNWDHLMMFSPLIFAGGFYAISLVGMALFVWLIWELCILIYPERFCEMTNLSLRCAECTDKLCTQYCQRLRK